MQAAVYRGNSKVVVEELPVPEIEKGEVLVRVESCGVCATDLKKIEYNLLPPPRIFGHEMAGIIEKVGKGVRGWRKGDRVAVVHHTPCHRCFYCKRKEYVHCSLYKKTGTTAGFEPAGGGFAQYIRVMPWIVKEGMFRVPSPISLEEATFIEPVNTCLKGVERLALRKGDCVLVFGQGPIGMMLAQLVKIGGSIPVGLDLMKTRLKISKKLGIQYVFDPRDASFPKALHKISKGRGADAAIIAVPSRPAFEQAIHLIRPGGKVLLFAHTKKGDFLNVDAGMICADEKTILGSYSSDVEVNRIVARLIFQRKIKVKPLISHRFPMNRVKDAFKLASHPSEDSLKILVNPWVGRKGKKQNA